MNFVELRQRHFRSRAALARACGISASKLGHFEHVQDVPSEEQLEALAGALGGDITVVVSNLVETMRQHHHMPPAVDWNPDRWYPFLADMIAERQVQRQQAEDALYRDLERLARPRTVLDRLIDQACLKEGNNAGKPGS